MVYYCSDCLLQYFTPSCYIVGGHFITRFARSYGLFMPRFARTFAYKEGDDLSLGNLKSIHVIMNMSSHWSIPADNDGKKIGQPEYSLDKGGEGM